MSIITRTKRNTVMLKVRNIDEFLNREFLYFARLWDIKASHKGTFSCFFSETN